MEASCGVVSLSDSLSRPRCCRGVAQPHAPSIILVHIQAHWILFPLQIQSPFRENLLHQREPYSSHVTGSSNRQGLLSYPRSALEALLKGKPVSAQIKINKSRSSKVHNDHRTMRQNKTGLLMYLIVKHNIFD